MSPREWEGTHAETCLNEYVDFEAKLAAHLQATEENGTNDWVTRAQEQTRDIAESVVDAAFSEEVHAVSTSPAMLHFELIVVDVQSPFILCAVC